jgi:hypothetical protein
MLKQRTYGMRFFLQDGIVIAITILITWYFWKNWNTLVLMLPVVLGHFFLFCNIFRIHRKYELIWASLFVINCLFWVVLMSNFSWIAILLTQSPMTLILILLGIRHPTYHGIFANQLNSKNLDRYLNREI